MQKKVDDYNLLPIAEDYFHNIGNLTLLPPKVNISGCFLKSESKLSRSTIRPSTVSSDEYSGLISSMSHIHLVVKISRVMFEVLI